MFPLTRVPFWYRFLSHSQQSGIFVDAHMDCARIDGPLSWGFFSMLSRNRWGGVSKWPCTRPPGIMEVDGQGALSKRKSSQTIRSPASMIDGQRVGASLQKGAPHAFALEKGSTHPRTVCLHTGENSAMGVFSWASLADNFQSTRKIQLSLQGPVMCGAPFCREAPTLCPSIMKAGDRMVCRREHALKQRHHLNELLSSWLDETEDC